MCQVQFSDHAIQRVLGRLSAVVSYGEVQHALSIRQLRECDNRILVKQLDKCVKIIDPSALGGCVQGNKVYALVTVRGDGCKVNTVSLSN